MLKKLAFTKMSGAGNDFIVIDAPNKVNLPVLARKMCDRTNGIGADGLLVLAKSRKADHKMRIINADGSEAEMCGNGARCMLAYIYHKFPARKGKVVMETLAGLVDGTMTGQLVKVHLSDPKDYQPDIPIKINGRTIKVDFINTGVPHAVVFVDEINNIDVSRIGQLVRYHNHFKPRGTNVNFVEQIDTDLIAARTYERGVEDETRACGTGSVAAAIISYRKANPRVKTQKGARMNVRTKSGEILEITFDLTNDRLSNVWLKGSARFIAKGEYYV